MVAVLAMEKAPMSGSRSSESRRIETSLEESGGGPAGRPDPGAEVESSAMKKRWIIRKWVGRRRINIAAIELDGIEGEGGIWTIRHFDGLILSKTRYRSDLGEIVHLFRQYMTLHQFRSIVGRTEEQLSLLPDSGEKYSNKI
jgi:hypothetical protein